MYRNGFQNYQRARVDTTDPQRLVVLCYDEMITQIKMARQRCIEKDFEGKTRALLKVQDILCELQCALDFEKGGAVAKNLNSLYNYFRTRIIQADTGKDLAAMDEIAGMMAELRSAWEEAFRSLDKRGVPSRSAPAYAIDGRAASAVAF